MAELNSFLTGIADAIRSKKGTTDKINASNFASEIESISGGGVVVVDELPTENIQEGVIYQVNELSDIDVYLKDDGSLPSNLNDAIRIGLGITPTLIYEVVDSLPSTPNISNLQTFNPAYVYIQNDIPYIYGNAGYGDMWLDIKTLIATVTNLTYENKGYVANAIDIVETGLYVTYKKGKQGISVIRGYDILVNDGDWYDYNIYKKIFNKTVEEYSNKTITVVPHHAFYQCNKLKKIYLPNCIEVHAEAFYETCLETIDENSLPKLEIAELRAFGFCHTKYIYLPELRVASFQAFEETAAIKIICPKLEIVEDNAFYYNPTLKYIELPSLMEASDNCFDSCHALTDVKIPNVKVIRQHAFADCIELSTIDLPKITQIYSWAFARCVKLKTVIIRQKEQVCDLQSPNAFDNSTVSNITKYSIENIYVPDALVEAYKIRTNWSLFGDKIKPLSEYAEE